MAPRLPNARARPPSGVLLIVLLELACWWRSAHALITDVSCIAELDPAEELEAEEAGASLAEACSFDVPFAAGKSTSTLHLDPAATGFKLLITGSDIYDEKSNHIDPPVIQTELSSLESSTKVTVLSCTAGKTPKKHGACKEYTFEIFRDLGPTLRSLVISPGTLEPNFSASYPLYTVQAQQGDPLTITAVGSSVRSLLGIEFDGPAWSSGIQKQGCCPYTGKKTWNIPPFRTVNEFVYKVLVMEPEGDMNTYKLTVQVHMKAGFQVSTGTTTTTTTTRLYPAKLVHFAVDGYKITPAFQSEVSDYRVDVPVSIGTVVITVEAKDDEALICFQSNDSGTPFDECGEPSEGVFLDASRAHVGSYEAQIQLPDYTNAVSDVHVLVRTASRDQRFMKEYRLYIHILGDSFSLLSSLTPSHCQLNPVFKPDHFEYECHFWYHDVPDGTLSISAGRDKNCSSCTLRMPRPSKKEDLWHSVSHEKAQEWFFKKPWSQKFQPGEHHELPITVISQNKVTRSVYTIYLVSNCPWYINAYFLSTMSKLASSLAAVIAATSAVNFVALTKLLQFIMLTSLIPDVPESYQNFASGMEVFNFDFTEKIPIPIPDLEDVPAWRLQAWTHAAARLDLTVPETHVVVQYCHTKATKGQLMANYVMDLAIKASDNPEDLKKKLPGLQKKLTALAIQRGHLRGSSPQRRLDEEEIIEELQDQRDGNDDEEEDKWQSLSTELIFEDQDWEAVKQNYTHSSVTEHTYPDFPCEFNTIGLTINTMRGLYLTEELAKFFFGSQGTFILTTFCLLWGIACYGLYFLIFMRNTQCRLQMLEPYSFWIFIFDLLLISFASSAAYVYNKATDENFDFAGVVIPPSFMHFLAGLCIIVYPFGFILGIAGLVFYLTKTTSVPGLVQRIFPCLQWGSGQLVIWNRAWEKYSDPVCRELRVPVESQFFFWVPILQQIFKSHIRACLPVLNSEGKVIDFPTIGAKKELKMQAVQVVTRKLQKLKDKYEKEDDAASKDFWEAKEKRWERSVGVQIVNDRQKQLKRRERHKTLTARRRKSNMVVFERDGGESGEGMPSWAKQGEDDLSLAGELENRCTSLKKRLEDERLEADEVFALKFWLGQKVRQLERLERYNILKVVIRNGFLVPEECEGEYDQNDDIGAFSNSKGERLVYEKHDSSKRAQMIGGLLPGGWSGGYLVWLREPDEGWDEWEKLVMEKNKDSCRYADKWQYLWYDHWKQPWHFDDDDDWEVFSGSFAAFDLRNIPLLEEAWQGIRAATKGRVAFHVPDDTKDEMKKWVWRVLKAGMLLKLTIAELSFTHPLYTGFMMNIEDVAKVPLKHVIREIAKAEPDSDILTASETKGDMRDELIQYTLMKFEDTHDFGDEPWWIELNQRTEEEETVMFDDDLFFKSIGDSQYEERRQHSRLMPRYGYVSSPCFQDYPGALVGTKRYTIYKADGSSAKVSVDVMLKHIIPLMRYTNGFKLNVLQSALELQHASNMTLVLGSARIGEEFNYAVDRFTTLVCLLVLFGNMTNTSKSAGRQCAVVFLMLRLGSYLMQVYSSSEEETAGEDDVGNEEDNGSEASNKPDDEGGAGTGAESMDEGEKAPLVGGGSAPEPKRRGLCNANFFRGDSSVLFLQTCILASLCLAEFGIMEPQLAALVAMLLIIATMIVMNLSSFAATADLIQEYAEKGRQRFSQLRDWLVTTGKRILNGANFMNVQFIAFTTDVYEADKVEHVAVFVPELGMTMDGRLDVDRELPVQDQLAQEVYKKTIYWVTRKRYNDKQRLKSAGEHPRFHTDIKNHLHIVFSPDQLMLEKEIPEVVATIQCLNHANRPEVCSPQFDSFLTLYKRPQDDVLEDEEMSTTDAQREAVLRDWKAEVEMWMKTTLGAVTNSQTCTEEIQRDIGIMLEQKLKPTADARDMFHVQVERIRVLATRGSVRTALLDRPGRLAVLHEGESLWQVIHPSRYSEFATFEPDNEPDDNSPVSPSRPQSRGLNEYLTIRFPPFAVPIPRGTNKLRFLVWVRRHDEGGFFTNYVREELVAFTDEISMDMLSPDRVAAEEEFHLVDHDLHCRWRTDMGEQQLEPRAAVQGEEFRTILRVQLPGYNAAELEEERRLANLVENVLHGENTMTHSKLFRHQDRWISLARYFGIPLTKEVLDGLKEHLAELEPIVANMPRARASISDLQQHFINNKTRRNFAGTDISQAHAVAETQISRLRQQIEEEETRLQSLAQRGVKGQPARFVDYVYFEEKIIHKPRRHAMLLREQGVLGSDNKSFETSAFLLELAELLQETFVIRRLASKEVLHYVFVSDQVKVSKKWRPDPISLHPAFIVTQEFDSIDLVLLSGATVNGEDIVFERMLVHQKPMLLNGRLLYKARYRELKGSMHKGDGDEEITDSMYLERMKAVAHTHKEKVKQMKAKLRDHLYLYWDGDKRWVVATHPGDKVRYQPAPGEMCVWVMDSAVTPDEITKPWHTWQKKKRGEESSWQRDDTIRMHTKSRRQPEAREQLDEEDDPFVDNAKPSCWERMTIATKEICSMVRRDTTSMLTPSLKDCLVGMVADNIVFRWKDQDIEDLGQFRKFLLTKFGSYEWAWFWFTRHQTFEKRVAEDNLVEIFKEGRALLKELSPETDTTGLLKWRHFLMDDLHQHEEGNLERLAIQVASALDADRSETISNLEIEALFERAEELLSAAERTKEDCDVLLNFQGWCKAHPTYKNFEVLWAHMSKGMVIDKESFQTAMRPLMVEFMGKTTYKVEHPSDDPEVLLANITGDLFHRLDPEGDGEVKYLDFIPASGKEKEQASQALLEFKIPLAHLQQFYPGRSIHVEDKKYRTFTLQVSPDFIENSPWSRLMRTLDSHWNPRDRLTLKFALDEVYYQLWQKVIGESQMVDKQEWIRFYEGDFNVHSFIPRVHMRVTHGMQTWGNGQVYYGGWHNHVYEGYGELWAQQTHMVQAQEEDVDYAGPPPIFAGEWSKGKRHGKGTLYWAPQGNKGKMRRYQGEFKDDLFNGKGELLLRSSPRRASIVTSSLGSGSDPGRAMDLPRLHLHAQKLLSFEGMFATSWHSALEQVCKAYPDYRELHGDEEKDLHLQTLKPDRKGVFKPADKKLFAKYFPQDATGAQMSGIQLPDLALAYYALDGMDLASMKNGIAKFANGLVYDGEMANGVPHGQGKLLGWNYGVYEGNWANGMFEGQGKLEIDAAYRATMGFNSYEGEWHRGVFHGEGKVVLGENNEYMFHGEFVNQVRSGHGQLWHKPPDQAEQLLYSGPWRKDRVDAQCPLGKPRATDTINTMCWVPLETKESGKHFFFGNLSEAGYADGEGSLFKAEAWENEEFRDAVRKGLPWTAEVVAGHPAEKPRSDDDAYLLYYPPQATLAKLKYLLYSGQWHRNKPDGYGMQYYKEGLYVGEFKEGKRNGQGMWESPVGLLVKPTAWIEGEWLYRPARGSKSPNWENDLMHGTGIVEDKGHVHENIMFQKGICLMPFTEHGPPRSNLDLRRSRLSMIGMGGSGAQKAHAPTGTGARFRTNTALISVGKTFGKATGTLATNSNLDLALPVSEDVMVREPTEDEELEMEDVYVSGGTGLNVIMNGLYYRLSNTFGYTLFKLTKKINPEEKLGLPVEIDWFVDRYLFYDTLAQRWILASKPLAGVEIAPGCATVKEKTTLFGVPNKSPADVAAQWSVWSTAHGRLRQHNASYGGDGPEFEGSLPPQSDTMPLPVVDGGASAATAKSVCCAGMATWAMGVDEALMDSTVDTIEVRAVIGFQVSEEEGHIHPRLFLRSNCTLFGRPVYQADHGGTFLYWVPDEDDLLNIWTKPSDESSGAKLFLEDSIVKLLKDADDHKRARFEASASVSEFTGTPGEKVCACDSLFVGEHNGHWVLSRSIGALPTEPGCLAYVPEMAATPDQIAEGTQWYIVQSDLDQKQYQSTKVKLVLMDTSFHGFEPH